jgi:hypothetical protein
MQNFNITANVMFADIFVMAAVNAFEGAGNFWDKYNEYISTGSNAANVLVHYMESSTKFGNYVKGIGYITGGIQLFTDIYSAATGEMNKERFIDATANAASLFGGGLGAGIAFEYNMYKNAGKFVIKAVKASEKKVINDIMNPHKGWIFQK